MNAIWFIATPEDLRFARRFLEYSSLNARLFHLNLITWALDARRFHKGILPFGKSVDSTLDLRSSFNVLSGRLTHSEAQRAYTATRKQLNRHVDYSASPCMFIIPSGRHVHHIAATDFAKSAGIPCLYINYSNFPGYTFFDPEGTDALSSVFRDPSLLERLPGFSTDSRHIQDVFSKYSQLKRNQTRIPQARRVGLSGWATKFAKESAFVIDSILQKILFVNSDRRFHRARATTTTNLENCDVRPIGTPSGRYFFFPLQVSTDQQVLVNYHAGSIISAINEALHLAKTASVDLVVREHPAEARPELVRKHICELIRSGEPIHASVAPMYELIDNAEEVITINSTVGLEARISGKRVRFIGTSFYGKATDAQLAAYLEHYLIPVDYHNASGLDRAITEEILARISLLGEQSLRAG